MTGAIGLPADPQEPPIETEGVGEDPGTVPEVDEKPEHDSTAPAFEDDPEPDELPRR